MKRQHVDIYITRSGPATGADALPRDILGLIFGYADTPQDLLRFGAVCSLWRSVANSHSLWKSLRFTGEPDFVSRCHGLHKSPPSMESMTARQGINLQGLGTFSLTLTLAQRILEAPLVKWLFCANCIPEKCVSCNFNHVSHVSLMSNAFKCVHSICPDCTKSRRTLPFFSCTKCVVCVRCKKKKKKNQEESFVLFNNGDLLNEHYLCLPCYEDHHEYCAKCKLEFCSRDCWKNYHAFCTWCERLLCLDNFLKCVYCVKKFCNSVCLERHFWICKQTYK